MAKKFYAVRRGHKVGLYTSWESCREQINGYSGAEYKGFNTEEEAFNYLSSKKKSEVFNLNESNCVNLYTSSIYRDGNISVGIVVESAKRSHSFYGVIQAYDYRSLGSIAGELISVLVGVQLARDLGYTRINIYYHNDGVANWFNRSWRANGELQRLYCLLLDSFNSDSNLSYTFAKADKPGGVVERLALRAERYNQYIDINSVLRGILTVSDVPVFG